MSQNANPLSASEPWNLVADGYAETTMLVFEQFADEAIAAIVQTEILFLSPASHWEIAIKIALGKYALPEPFAQFMKYLVDLGCTRCYYCQQ
jgi:PIN domain nuclease of toxin-antitoxin system